MSRKYFRRSWLSALSAVLIAGLGAGNYSCIHANPPPPIDRGGEVSKDTIEGEDILGDYIPELSEVLEEIREEGVSEGIVLDEGVGLDEGIGGEDIIPDVYDAGDEGFDEQTEEDVFDVVDVFDVADGADAVDGVLDSGSCEVFNLYCKDKDEDGFGNPEDCVEACFEPEEGGYVLIDDDNYDCDDDNSGIHPGAPELCDGLDNDCDEKADEELIRAYYTGPEGTEKVGLCKAGLESCVNGVWDVISPEVVPSAEVCDGQDNNCNGYTDENLGEVFYKDGDGDTFGDLDSSIVGCLGVDGIIYSGGQKQEGYVKENKDCDDGNKNINPDALEVCNGLDEDCDKIIDNGGDELCDDGLYCNGAEVCLGEEGCGLGIPSDDCCENDSECDVLDGNYCDGDLVMYKDWSCIDFKCVGESTTVKDCNLEDKDECEGTKIVHKDYSCLEGSCVQNGSSSCNVAECKAECDEINNCADNTCSVTYDDYCSGKKLVEYNGNKFLDSTTVNDSCENSCLEDCLCTDCVPDCSEAPVAQEYCVLGVCGADCEAEENCPGTECDHLDGCVEGTYRDYMDRANSCLESCECSVKSCTLYSEKITDADKDGYDLECEQDCDDTDENVWRELTGYPDLDKDGYTLADPVGGICSGESLPSGYEAAPSMLPDCDDNDASIYPGAEEICDGKDNDCDGEVDEGCPICWERTFGGSYPDWAKSIQQTSDGGYVVAGRTESKGTGLEDAWILKLDSKGNLQWDKIFGGSDSDGASSIQQTTDSGYIVAGWTDSKGAGERDAWVLKLAQNGNLEWEKTFGGSDSDGASSIQQTSDGGYIVAGVTHSKGAGLDDAWVLKLDEKGNLEWDKTFGGSIYDVAYSIQQTTDSGYIVAGWTRSKGAGERDAWVLKLAQNGNLEWDKTFGGSEDDEGWSIQQTADGGYIAAGYTRSKGAGGCDAWVFKLEPNGELEWERTFGGDGRDEANSIQQTTDLGYIVAGWTGLKEGDVGDGWILKLNSNGDLKWDKTYGGEEGDYANSIQQTSDGGYVVAGRTDSKGAGGDDVWILKLDQEGNLDCK